ncbi:hypothetical protein NIES4102_16130 [Chondrocystis sp. NIES-4102]|nr:hypothetical protein NIES4102_16130 [Chondrocystis sp. NIES-4102]
MSKSNIESLDLNSNPLPTAQEKKERSLKDIYCLSGLGADKRVFQKLRFQGYQPIHIQWLEPESKEDITAYAKRLIPQIKSDSPILIGLSFGGIIAVEIAKQIPTQKVILISSIKSKQENPFYFKIWRWFPIHRLLPIRVMLWLSKTLVGWFFSLQNLDERQLLNEIIIEMNGKLLKWSINQIVVWRNELVPPNVYQINGDRDRIFPARFIEENYTIEHGGHLMIMNQAESVSQLIQKIIET